MGGRYQQGPSRGRGVGLWNGTFRPSDAVRERRPKERRERAAGRAPGGVPTIGRPEAGASEKGEGNVIFGELILRERGRYAGTHICA